MDYTKIEVRDGGFASIFRHGDKYRREPGDGSGPRWSKQTADGSMQVSAHRAHTLERIYHHPKRYEKVRRFPRLPKTAALINSFFDIPLTSNLPGQKMRWLVDGLIPEGELILITGTSGSLKSILVEALAAAVCRGRNFLERSTTQTMVLLIDGENPLHIIAERRDTFHIVEGSHLRIWGSWQENLPSIGDPRLLGMARDHHLVIIFDSLVRFHSADENSTKEMAPIMGELRKLVTAGATVIVLHHDTKAGKNRSKYRGSSDILAGVDVAFNLVVNDETNPPTVAVDCFKHRGMEEFTLTIRPDFERGRFDLISDSRVQGSEKITAKLKSLIVAEPGLNQGELKKRSGLPEDKVRKALAAGENIHWIVKRPERKTKTYYPLVHSR